MEDAIALSQDGLRDDDDDDDDDLISPDRRLFTTVLVTPGSTFIYLLRYLQSIFSDKSFFRNSKKFDLHCRVATGV